MVAEDRTSGKVEARVWPHGEEFGFQTATDGQI